MLSPTVQYMQYIGWFVISINSIHFILFGRMTKMVTNTAIVVRDACAVVSAQMVHI